MSIESKKRGDGKTVYRVRFIDHLGKRRCRTFDRSKDARDFEASTRIARQRGDLPTLTKGKTPFPMFAQVWIEHRRGLVGAEGGISLSTFEMDERVVERHLKLRITGPLSGFMENPKLGDELAAAMRKDGVGPDMLRRVLTVLKSMMRSAHEWGYLPAHPLQYLRIASVERKREITPIPVPVVEAMRDALLADDDAQSALLISVLAYCGLRPSEALALRWRDLGDSTLHVNASLGDGDRGRTKTKRSIRSVPVPAPLLSDLRAQQMATGGRGDGPIFPASGGGFFRSHDKANWRKRVFAPLVSSHGFEGARPYDLRHTFCSLLIHEGRSVVEVARWAGHAPTMTLDTYAHVFEDAAAGERVPMIEQIEEARRQSATATPPHLSIEDEKAAL